MTLGEFRRLVLSQLGPEARNTPQEIDLALKWALDSLASEAAKARGQRWLMSTTIDKLADVAEYRLPTHIRSVKGVDDLSGLEPLPYSPVSFTQRAQPNESGFYGEGGGGAWYTYWVTHRTLHISPTPSSTESNALRLWYYGSPELPIEETDDMPVPPEAERYVIAKAAEVALPPPPPEYMDSISRSLLSARAQLTDWLYDSVVDVPVSTTEDGGLW